MKSSLLSERVSAAASAASLEVFLLGLVEYEAALALMERLVYEVSGRVDAQGTLLLCEHPPVISIGREGSRAEVRAEEHDLQACEIDVRWVPRGGGAFVHAPGQLAVYPVLPLDRLGVGLGEFRRRLEETLVAACRDVRVPAKRDTVMTGVWSRGGQVGHFGAAVKSWVSCHGAFLNVSVDPEFLRLVQPNEVCERPTSLEAQRLRPVAMHRVRESVIHHLAAKFGYERLHVYTEHPLLVRATRKVYVGSLSVER